MYLSFYHLKHKPFQISTDPKFLWLGEKHEEALATLKYGVLDNKGFLLLTGDVGTGKTTLINTLLRTLGKNTLVASIRDPALDPMDFYNYTAHAFGLHNNFTSKGSFLIEFEKFLRKANSAKKKVLLIIDEAQRINQVLLEEVRLLSNIEKDDSKLLNIFFVGQIEFNEILLRAENRPIRQRITVNYNIPTLTKKETGEYILHRLKIAGSKIKIFEEEALDEIFSFSKGYPRLINIICDRSLLTGFVEESKTITLKHVKECAKELEIPKLTLNNNTVHEIAEEYQDNSIVPLQGEVPVNHISKKQKNSSNKNITRNMALAACILLFSVLCYFSFTDYKFHPLQGHMIIDSVKNFWQQTDKELKTMSTDTEIATTSTQHKPVLNNDLKPASQEEALIDNTLPGNEVRTPEKKSARDKDVAEVVNTGAPEYAEGTEPLKGKTKINRIPKVVTGTNEFNKSENTNPAPKANNSPPEKNIFNEAEQIENQEIQLNSLVTFEKLVIPFPSNSNFPPGNSLDNLNMLVKSLHAQPSYYKIIVTGFTDSQGNEAFNEKLSEFRANTIKSYLVGRGLEASRIIVQGFGSQFPLASNNTFSGRMANRRVEIEIERDAESLTTQPLPH